MCRTNARCGGRTWSFMAAFIPAVVSLLHGCTRSTPSNVPTVDEYIIDCTVAEDSGAPTASDENLAAFINAEAAGNVMADACRSPQLAASISNATLDRSTPPTFSFSAKGATCLLETPGRQRSGCAAPPERRSALARVVAVAAAVVERQAEAHCAAFTGENYYFRLMRAGEARPAYSALLSVTSFTPDATIWKNALSRRAG